MNEKIGQFIEWLKGSADNNPEGASSKKLTGFWLIVFVLFNMINLRFKLFVNEKEFTTAEYGTPNARAVSTRAYCTLSLL